MKIYHLKVAIEFLSNESEHFSNIYTAFDKALEAGKQYLQNNEIERDWYAFEIEKIEDIEYAENFDIKLYPKEEYLKQNIQPTHKVYNLDSKGNIKSIDIQYRIKQKEHTYARLNMFPEDFEEGAGEKFKIGDIVTVKKDEYRNTDFETYIQKRLYVVRWLPRRVEGSKYFENTYALISNYYDGLFTHEERENNIQKYNGKIDPESPIGFLQRIIKNEIAVSKETWNNLKTGKILLDDRANYKDLLEFQEGDSWGFYSNTLTKRRTGLPANLLVSFGSFYTSIKDNIPKIRVNATEDFREDFYISISKNPKVIIGKNKLPKKEFQKICEFIIKNYEGLIQYWNSNCEMDVEDLYKLVGIKK